MDDDEPLDARRLTFLLSLFQRAERLGRRKPIAEKSCERGVLRDTIIKKKNVARDDAFLEPTKLES